MTANLLTNKRQQNLRPNEVIDNKEDIQLIWLDENMNDSADYRRTQLMLLEVNPAVQFYSNIDRCFDLIKNIKDEQIFLIVSSTFAQRVPEQIPNHRTIIAIFIFCINHQHDESLVKEHSQFVEIFIEQDVLLKSIRQKINLIEKQTFRFSIFDQKEKSSKDLSKESASFLLHQMLIFVLKQIPQDKQSKQHMLDISRDYYKNNKFYKQPRPVSTLLKGLIRWLVHIRYNPKAITKTEYSTLILNKRELVLRCMTSN